MVRETSSCTSSTLNFIFSNEDLYILANIEKKTTWHEFNTEKGLIKKYPHLVVSVNQLRERIIVLTPEEMESKIRRDYNDYRITTIERDQNSSPAFRIEFPDGKIALTTLPTFRSLQNSFNPKLSYAADPIKPKTEFKLIHTFQKGSPKKLVKN